MYHPINRFINVTQPQRNGAPHYVASSGKPQSARQILREAYADVKEPAGIKELVEKIERDVQFYFGYLIISSLAQSIEVSITSNVSAPDPRTEALMDNFKAWWDAMLVHAMRSFAYGRQAFEYLTIYSRQFDARVIGRIDPLPFECTEMNVDPETGRYEGIIVKTDNECIPIPKDRSWWCALDADPKNLHGRSRYLGAPLEVWKKRRELDKNEEIFLKKYALGHGVIYCPSKYDNRDSSVIRAGTFGEVELNGQPSDPLADGRSALADLRSGGNLSLPSEPHKDSGVRKWEYIQPTSTQNAQPLENRRAALDVDALRSLGIPDLAIATEGDVGSYALGSERMKVLNKTVEGVFGQIATSFEQNVMWPVSALNFRRPPLFFVEWKTLSESAITQKIQELLTNVIVSGQVSPLLTEGVLDVSEIVKSAQMPLGQDWESGLARISAAASQQALLGGPPARFATRIDLSVPPPVMSQEEAAEEAIAREQELLEEVRQLLDDVPMARFVDRGRL
jgi:hypothetical protein